MEDEELRPESAGCAAQLTPLAALAALVWSVWSIAAAFPVSDPDHFTGFRYGLGLTNVALLTGVLRWSSRYRGRGPRIWLGICAGLFLICGLCVVLGEQLAHSQTLWPVLLPLIGVATALAWRVRQRWLTVLAAGIVLAVAVVAVMPPGHAALPITRRSGQLSLSLAGLSASEYGVSDHVTLVAHGWSAPIRGIQSRPRVRSTVGGLVPLSARADLVHFRTFDGGSMFGVWTAAPDWTRSFDLEVSVPERPRNPAVSLEVSVPAPGKVVVPEPGAWSGLGDGVSVAIRRVSDAGRPEGSRQLELELVARGTDLMDPAAVWVGRPGAELITVGFNGTGTPEQDDLTLTVELPDERETIRVDILSPRQIREAWHTFRFPRLPNLPPGESIGEPPMAVLPEETGDGG